MDINVKKMPHAKIYPINSPATSNRTPGVRIIQVGAGGTGGYVASQLMRIIAGMPQKDEISYALIDGDTFEPKNLGRQLCTPKDIGENKAANIVRKYGTFYGLNNVRAFTEYITENDNNYKYIEDGDTFNSDVFSVATRRFYGRRPIIIAIDCVDKNKPRKILNTWLCDWLNKCQHNVILDNCLQGFYTYLISSGNGAYQGQVFMGRKVASFRSPGAELETNASKERLNTVFNKVGEANIRDYIVRQAIPGISADDSWGTLKEKLSCFLCDTPWPYEQLPNLIDVAQDAREEAMSCADRAAANVQNLVTNQTAANLVVNYVTSILRGLYTSTLNDVETIDCYGVYFNAQHNTFQTKTGGIENAIS